MNFFPKTKWFSLSGLSQEFWSLVWNASEYFHIGLGRFAPIVFGKMIGAKPQKFKEKKYPRHFMPDECWDKAFWNYSEQNWIDMINGFSSFPIKEYNKHIGQLIDMYLPDDLNFKMINNGL